MLLAALVSAGHFLAFFSLAAALVLELALLSETMSVDRARRIQRADVVAGIAATAVLVFGFLRVFYFDKGSDYYLGNYFFQIKLTLFLIAAFIAVYPALQFRRWKSELKQGIAPDLSAVELHRIKSVIHWELVLVGGIILCASLMARGFGS